MSLHHLTLHHPHLLSSPKVPTKMQRDPSTCITYKFLEELALGGAVLSQGGTSRKQRLTFLARADLGVITCHTCVVTTLHNLVCTINVCNAIAFITKTFCYSLVPALLIVAYLLL